MKQKLLLILGIPALVLILIGLNAASYVQKQDTPESELYPFRTSYNFGPTGTNAFYKLIAATGQKVKRWENRPSDLVDGKNTPKALIMIAPFKKELTESDTEYIFRWISNGGRLVFIGRELPESFSTRNPVDWDVSISRQFGGYPDIDPFDQAAMTKDVPAAKPVNLTSLNQSINSIQPSIFASAINIRRINNSEFAGDGEKQLGARYDFLQIKTPPPAAPQKTPEPEVSYLSAPVVHLGNQKMQIVAETQYGSGRIIYISDPYVVSNTGIKVADNGILGVNAVSIADGFIAFDEYHHGYGANENKFLQFFAGTPVVPIFLQLVLFVFALCYTRSRRFARALPDDEPDRLTKLEYVQAMAGLQQNADAYDIAIENVYGNFKIRASRLLGLEVNGLKLHKFAKAVAERLGEDEHKILQIFAECENVQHGQKEKGANLKKLVEQVREIETRLGLSRGRRQLTNRK